MHSRVVIFGKLLIKILKELLFQRHRPVLFSSHIHTKLGV